MSERAPIGVEPLTLPHEEPVGEPPRRGLGVFFAAMVALVASGALAWWIAKPNPPAEVAGAPAPAAAPSPHASPAAPVRYAAAEPDPVQVRRALADVQQVYAEGGAEGLVQASAGCARQLAADPGRLDYCLAYDIYAVQVAPPGSGPAAADWFQGTRDRDLALARAALPASVDATNRLAQVAELSRAVLPKALGETEPVRGGKAALHKPAEVKAKQVGKAAAAKPRAAKAKAATTSRYARLKAARARSDDDWTPPGPSTLDEQYAREAAAEAELDRQISQGLVDPPH